MPARRRMRVAPGLAGVLVLLLGATACSGSGGSRASSAAPSSRVGGVSGASSAGASSGTSAGPTGAPFDATCRTAPQIRSARVDANTLAGGQLFRVQGVEQLSDGQLQAADLDVSVDGKHTRVVISNRVLYAKGPGVGRTDKFLVVSEHESDQTVRGFEFELGLTLEYARPGLFCDIRAAATSVRSAGSRTVRGIRVTSYTFSAVASRLPATSVLRAEQSQSAVTSVATTMDVDAEGRPVQLAQRYTVGRSTLSSGAVLYDPGVSARISAPSASEISH